MAGAPNKEGGILYQSRKLDFESKRSFEQLLAEHPDKGYEIWDRLTVRILNGHGYFIEWNTKQCRYLAAKFSTTKEKMNAVLETCFLEQIFNRDLYDRHGILTSVDLQLTYLRASTRRKQILIIKEFSLVEPEYLIEEKISDKTFHVVYDDVDTAFDADGMLLLDWKRRGKLELVVRPTDRRAKWQREADEDLQGQAANKPAFNAFNWDKEKQQLREEKNWQQEAAHFLVIGKYEGTDFKMDQARMAEALEEFFRGCAARDKKQTCEKMKGHFISWYPKWVAGKQNKVANSAQQVGQPNFKDMDVWP